MKNQTIYISKDGKKFNDEGICSRYEGVLELLKTKKALENDVAIVQKQIADICPHVNIERKEGYMTEPSYPDRYGDYIPASFACKDCGAYATDREKSVEGKELYKLLYKRYFEIPDKE